MIPLALLKTACDSGHSKGGFKAEKATRDECLKRLQWGLSGAVAAASIKSSADPGVNPQSKDRQSQAIGYHHSGVDMEPPVLCILTDPNAECGGLAARQDHQLHFAIQGVFQNSIHRDSI